jgi:hypothetical protein
MDITSFSKTSLNDAGIKSSQGTVQPYSDFKFEFYQRLLEIKAFHSDIDLSSGMNRPLYSEDLHKKPNGDWDLTIKTRFIGQEQGPNVTYSTSKNIHTVPTAIGDKVNQLNDPITVNRFVHQSQAMMEIAFGSTPIYGVVPNLGDPSIVSAASRAAIEV